MTQTIVNDFIAQREQFIVEIDWSEPRFPRRVGPFPTRQAANDWGTANIRDGEWLTGPIMTPVRSPRAAEQARQAVVDDFIAEREQFMFAIKNCPPGNLADYHRWQGHAEARRQLAERLAAESVATQTAEQARQTHHGDAQEDGETVTDELRASTIEAASELVHNQWMATKRGQGVTSRRSESGEELMVPYSDLSESAKDLDRGSVTATVDALVAIGWRPPLPTSPTALPLQ